MLNNYPINDELEIKINTSISIITSLYQINITRFNNDTDIQNFCALYNIHPSQRLFNADYLAGMLDNINSHNIYHVIDSISINCIVFSLKNIPFVVGPFSQNAMSRKDAQNIIRRFENINLVPEQLMAYHGSFPVLTERNAHKLISTFINTVCPEENEKELRLFRYDEKDDNQFYDKSVPAPNTNMLEKRYMHEEMFKHSIASGNAREALYHLHMMEQDTAFYKTLGNVVENEKIGAVIDHTVIRLAALSAKLPIVVIDRITSDNMGIIAKAQNTETIINAKEDLIRSICRAILEMKSQKYSAVIQSALYYLDRHFTDKISLTELSEELGISENYLIKKFKAETGMTPTVYTNSVRMKRAEVLLLDGSMNICDISNAVGIDDANYFVKLFKKHIGQTPSEYRKSHTI